jgi:hypothetical protein
MMLAVVGDGPAHGYALIELLKQRSGGVFDLPEGTVYPALHRLEAEGLLASGWPVYATASSQPNWHCNELQPKARCGDNRLRAFLRALIAYIGN